MTSEASLEAKIGAVKLAARVLEASKKGRIDWSESGDDDSFYTFLAGRALTVRSDDGDASHPFTLWVAESGEILETVNTVDDQDQARLTQAVPDWQEIIAALYVEGRKRGQRINRVLDEMFDDLSRKDPEEDDDIPF